MNLGFVILAIVTTLSRGAFVTDCSVEIKAPVDEANPYVDRLMYELQTNPDLLFSWAFKGTGKQAEEIPQDRSQKAQENSKDAILLNLQSIEFDSVNRVSHMVYNIDVGGVPKFKNINVETQVLDSMVGFNRHMRLNIKYDGPLVKKVYCNFRVMPQSPSTCRLEVTTYLKFGWFFSIFVSKKMYKNVLEWRIERFMNNMKEITETGEVQ